VGTHRAILIGIGIGAALGVAMNLLQGGAPWLVFVTDEVVHPIGQIFLRLLFMLVIPLLFSALILGIAELDLRHLGRIGLRTLVFTAAISLIAVLIGLGLVNALEPGRGTEALIARGAGPVAPAEPPSGSPGFAAIVPDNVVRAAAEGDIIALVFFAVVFGIGISAVKTTSAEKLLHVIRGVFDVSMYLIEMVLKLTPIGVGALLFTLTARLGIDVFQHLFSYVLVVLLGLALHMFLVYPASLWVLARKSPLAFFRESWLAIVTAFSTSSSNATLPTALKVAEEKLLLPPHVARFVLTAGATMNQNGTALFEGVTVLFLAQVYGVPLGIGEQLGVLFVCVMAGIGTAGVPAGSLPVIAIVLQRYGIPVEGLGLILGVDRFLDMCRTTLNVTGDLVAAVVVSRGET
jgi:DAACS family dicarboxylate/amino acid:cation (Na+ or H+) symporter